MSTQFEKMVARYELEKRELESVNDDIERIKRLSGYIKVRRVWVLVEVEEPTVDISNPQWERIEDDI